MRRISTVLVALVILFGFFIIVDVGFDTITMNASATTFYVGGSGSGNYSTIQEAINDADPGDTIFVYSGEYDEPANPLTAISIDKTITLIGEDRDTTIINATGKREGILITNANYVNISGFTVIGANFYNIRLYPSNHSYIYDNILKNSFSFGLGMSPGSDNLIENNNITENPKGVLITGLSSGNILKNNEIISCSDRAISIENGATENLISHNTISGYKIGLYIYESYDNRIENNQISNGIEDGVKIFDLSSSLLLNNYISDNDVGVKVFDYASATIINCTIQNSDSYDIWVGDTVWPKGDIVLLNSNFDFDNVNILDDLSSLTVQWYLQVEVIDESDEPVSGATVRITDNWNSEENHTTNSEGKVSWIALTNYIQTSGGVVFYTPHNITAYNATSFGYTEPEITMSASKEIIVRIFSDFDGDGVFDVNDPFPSDPTQWMDSDGDGYGDNASGNEPDVFPNDPNEWKDTDGDEVGDNADEFPNDPDEWEDSDGDGIGDNSDFLPSLHNTIFFLIIGIIIIVILVILALMFKKKGKKPAKWGEEEENSG